jgi:hypothetical protein
MARDNQFGQYYLETNALYDIQKISQSQLPHCFTSILSLSELLNGLTQENYLRRKNILKKVLDSGIRINWTMPVLMIFFSFNVSKYFMLKYGTAAKVQKLLKNIQESNDFEDFITRDVTSLRLNLKKLEEDWALGYVSAAIMGREVMRLENVFSTEPIVVNDRTYAMDTLKDLRTFLLTEFGVARQQTIRGQAAILWRESVIRDCVASSAEIVDSYNGFVDHFIDASTRKQINVFTRGDLPKLNDYTDLLHLVYLENIRDRFIVSNDRIFNIEGFNNRLKVYSLF